LSGANGIRTRDLLHAETPATVTMECRKTAWLRGTPALPAQSDDRPDGARSGRGFGHWIGLSAQWLADVRRSGDGPGATRSKTPTAVLWNDSGTDVEERSKHLRLLRPLRRKRRACLPRLAHRPAPRRRAVHDLGEREADEGVVAARRHDALRVHRVQHELDVGDGGHHEADHHARDPRPGRLVDEGGAGNDRALGDEDRAHSRFVLPDALRAGGSRPLRTRDEDPAFGRPGVGGDAGVRPGGRREATHTYLGA
jgi:hypothetical protein